MDLNGLVQKLAQIIINPLIQIIFAAAVIVFLWGVVEYIGGADNPEKRKTGGNHILWGIVGMFLMVAAFGIIQILLNTFGIDTPTILN